MTRPDRRRRRCAPRLLELEGRTLLSAAPLGVNVSYNNYFGSTNQSYVDVRNLFRSWYDPASGQGSSATLPRTADGYPLVPATTYAYLGGYPTGSYQFSYRGRASLSFSRQGRLEGSIVTGADGVSRGTLAYTAGDDVVMLHATGLDPNDPFRDLTITTPGYAPGSDRMYTDDYLRRLAPFSTLRFMDWSRSNTHTEVEWSDRESPASFEQSGDIKGTAWEYAIELANEARKDIWINVPDQASDDYVTRLARLLRDTLNSASKIYVEYSNEVWNGYFPQHARVVANARANPLITATDDSGRAAQQAAFRMKQISDIFRREFRAEQQEGRVHAVFAGFAAYSGWNARGLAFVDSLYGDPSRYFSSLSIAPYVDLPSGSDYWGQTMDGLFAGLNKFVDTTMTDWVRANVAVASRYNLPLTAYEGGQSLNSTNGVNGALKIAAQSDPRMGQLYERMMRAWEQQGGGLFMHYSHIARSSKWGSWGLLETITDRGSPKWDALLRRTLPAGDLSLDGAVDYDDFVGFRPGYFSSGQFWEQGDFNGDRLVDAVDLDALRANMGRTTPAQAAEIALFGAPDRAVSGRALTLDATGKTLDQTYSWTVSRNGVAVASRVAGPGGPAGLTFTPDGAGTYVVYLTVRDASGATASATTSVTVSAANGAAGSRTVDESHPGFASVGVWNGYANPAAHAGNYRVAAPGGGAEVASWTIPLAPGRYRVLASWPAGSTRAVDAAYAVADGAATLGVAAVNQRAAPAGVVVDGVAYQDLGAVYTLAGNALTVRLASRPSGTVAADSIRVEPVADGQSQIVDDTGAATARSMDDSQAGFASVGVWNGYANPAAHAGNYRVAAPGGGAEVASWTIPLAPGRYRVLASWPAGSTRAVDAAYAVADGAATLGVAAVNQRAAPAGVVVDGVAYQDLGAVYTLAGNALTVRLASRPSGTVAADSIRVEPVADGAAGSRTVDESHPGFASVGVWNGYANPAAHAGNYRVAAPGGGAEVASWTIPLAPGRYRVLASWPAGSTRAVDAAYAVADGAATLGVAAVNQRAAPAGVVVDGVAYQDLGAVYTLAGNALTVRLASRPSGTVAADSIRVEPVADGAAAGPEPTGFSTVGNWALRTGEGFGGDVREGDPYSPKDSASWSFVVAPGRYLVQATWSSRSDRTSAAPYAILDDAAVVATIRVDQRARPVGVVESGVTWQSLGGPVTVSSSALTVRLSNRVTGSIAADAIRIVRLSDAAPEPTPAPWLQFADDGDAGYVTAGPWQSVTTTGHAGDVDRLAPSADAEASASYVFRVTPGRYRVSTLYAALASASAAAPFTLYDGAKPLGTIQVDQRTFRRDRQDGDFRFWQDLGASYAVTGSTLTVRVGAARDGTVSADAIRVERIGGL